jgi:hypothetical protein
MKTSTHLSRNAGVALAGLGLSLFAGLASAGSSQWIINVPEPSVISLMAAGAAAIVILARLNRKK